MLAEKVAKACSGEDDVDCVEEEELSMSIGLTIAINNAEKAEETVV